MEKKSEQQISLLDLLQLNFNPKPTIDNGNGSTSLTIHPISQALIQPSPHADHRTHSNTISITDPQPPLPQSTNPLISPKTSIEQQFPTHDSSLNNNKNNNNNNNTATTLPNQSNNPSVPETTLPSEQLTSPHPQSITQENTQSKPTTDETTEDIRLQKYMAINLVNQIKTQPTMFFNPFSSQQSFVPQPTANPNHSPTSKTNILASPHPHPPHSASSDKLTSNVGLQINSSFPPQELAISTDQVNPEILYTADPPPHVLPITLFPTNMIFAPGNKVAVDGFISYATKAGRIRVIDQNSGARMLLRKHDGPVIDMCIGRPRGLSGDLNHNSSNNHHSNNHNHNHNNNNNNTSSGSSNNSSSSRRWRCIASAGSDGRLVIWKIPVRFEEDSATYEVLADILSVDTHLLLGPEKDHVDSPRTERFSAIRWHPRDPSVFLVSTNDHRLILVRLDRGAFAPMWKRGMPLGKTLSELEAFEGQDVLRTSCDVIAFAFSPDGSAFAFVTSDNILTVRQTSKPHWTIMGGQLTQNGGPISRLEFLSTPQGIIKGFLISKRYGTRVEAVQLSEISDVVIAINLQAPEPQDDGEKALPCFGHVVWQKQYSTILLSNSLRGSIFAFHVNFCESSSNEDEMIPLKPIPSMTGGVEGNHRLAAHQEDDSSYIERVAATRQQSSKMQRSRSNSWVASRTMFVDHISEVASPDPIISFVLDEGMRPAPGPSSSDCSIFNLHPKGIHQLYLPKAVIHHQRPSTDTHDPLAPTVPPARSLSLAGEILVDVQVEQEVAQAEELELSDEKNSSRPIGAAAPSSVPPSQNGKQNPTRTPAAAAAPPHKHSRSSTDNFLPSSDTLVTHQPIPPAISPSSLEIILREVEKTREGVAFEFHNLFVKAIEKQDQRLRNQFIAQSEIETRRHEHLMNVVSSNSGSNSAMSNAKNVAKLVEQAVRNELRYSPGFSGLSKGFEQSVLELVKRGVQEGFKKQLGQEVEGVMKKPQVMELIRNLVSQGVGQETAEKLERVVRTTLIPMLVESATSQQASMNGVVQEVRQLAHELHEVRAGAGNAEEIRELKATVAGLREQVADLHETLKLALAASSLHPSSTLAAPAPAPAPPGGLSTSWRGTSADRSTQPSQPGPNSSRTATPPSAYEDMFLEALSDRAPGLLSKLIDDGPHDRLESVFLRASANNNNNQSSSRLSQPVLLTLAHKLSEQLAIPASSAADDRPGSAEDRFASSLGARGANRLRWIWRCVDAVDEQDRQTAQYLARVLDLSYSHLHARKLALIQAGGIKEEIEGINQVLWIIEDKLAKFRAVASAADR